MRIERSMLADLARGAAFLGSGGGGDPYYRLLLAEAAIERCGAFDLIAPGRLADDALVLPCGWRGVPTVCAPTTPSGHEALAGDTRLEHHMARPLPTPPP